MNNTAYAWNQNGQRREAASAKGRRTVATVRQSSDFTNLSLAVQTLDLELFANPNNFARVWRAAETKIRTEIGTTEQKYAPQGFYETIANNGKLPIAFGNVVASFDDMDDLIVGVSLRIGQLTGDHHTVIAKYVQFVMSRYDNLDVKVVKSDKTGPYYRSQHEVVLRIRRKLNQSLRSDLMSAALQERLNRRREFLNAEIEAHKDAIKERQEMISLALKKLETLSADETKRVIEFINL